jgi:hypothetical protein
MLCAIDHVGRRGGKISKIVLILDLGQIIVQTHWEKSRKRPIYAHFKLPSLVQKNNQSFVFVLGVTLSTFQTFVLLRYCTQAFFRHATVLIEFYKKGGENFDCVAAASNRRRRRPPFSRSSPSFPR